MRRTVLLALTAWLLAPAALAETFQKTIVDFSFGPPLTINVGDTVVWTNRDAVGHTVTSGTPGTPSGVFNSGVILPDQTFSHTFTTAGEFPYFCQPHPFMTSSIIVQEAGPATVPLGLRLVAEGLTSPVAMIPVPAPDTTGRRFIVDQIGLIRVLMPDGTLLPEPFLDVRSKMVTLGASYDERGLLGMAFHPGYATNGKFYVYYSAPLRTGAPDGWDHTSHISEFQVSATNPNVANPNSERIVLQVDEPQSNHNGGSLAFGPTDGFLYISLGDGGRANDTGTGHPPLGNGQDITTILGSILRIDVNGAAPYAIPADNPLIAGPGVDEIYAYGFRNPYRMSFDMGGTHELFVGDAGQGRWEEVSIVTKGGNYGWNIKEGTHCFNPQDPNNPPDTCPSVGPNGEPLIDPVIEFANSANPAGGLGAVVVGGYVYRGTGLPHLNGKYVFGSWSTAFGEKNGDVLVATRPASGLWTIELASFPGRPNERLGEYVLAFGQDNSGEVYVLTTENQGPSGNTGKVYQLVIPAGVTRTNLAAESDNAIAVGRDENGLAVVAMAAGSTLHLLNALAPSTPAMPNWDGGKPLGGLVVGRPAFGAVNNSIAVAVGTQNGRGVAFDLESGDIVADITIENASIPTAPAIVSNGATTDIYWAAQTADGPALIVSRGNASSVAADLGASGVQIVSSPAVVGGVLIVGTSENIQTFRVDPISGALTPQSVAGGGIDYNTSPVVGRNGQALIGAGTGEVLKVVLETGSIDATPLPLGAGAAPLSNPFYSAATDQAVFGGADGNVYYVNVNALGTAPSLADTRDFGDSAVASPVVVGGVTYAADQAGNFGPVGGTLVPLNGPAGDAVAATGVVPGLNKVMVNTETGSLVAIPLQ